jgi:NADH:ubiquinone oxidoreductase subunit 2 (subunit N)
MLLRVLRIGGVPPFSGFFIKVYGLSIIVWSGNFRLSLIFCLFAIIRLSYYINIVFSCLLFCVFSEQSYFNVKSARAGLWRPGGRVRLIIRYLSISRVFFIVFFSAFIF